MMNILGKKQPKKVIKNTQHPRTKTRVRNEYGVYDAYTLYTKRCKERNIKPVSNLQFRKINKHYAEYIRTLVIYKSKRVQLGYGIGSITILKYHVDIQSINDVYREFGMDFKVWKTTGIRVPKINKRDNHKYKITWITNRIKGYRFLPCRKFKRNTAYILNNKFEIDYHYK